VATKPDRQTFYALRCVSNLRALRRDEPTFRELLAEALSAVSKLGRDKAAEYGRFLDSVCVRLIETPTDVRALCDLLPDEDAKLELLRFIARHPLVDFDLLIAFATSPEVLGTLPLDSSWVEPIVLTYGSSKLAENRKLSIEEIAPLGLDVERATVRSLLGSALDAGLLLEGEELRLLELFPSDKYFQGRIKRPGPATAIYSARKS